MTKVTSRVDAAGDLQLPPDEMIDLAHRVTELLVERTKNLPEENAWEGEFRQVLEDQLFEDPPEDGRSAAEVIERAAREILPLTARIDHPRFFGFIPSSPTWPGVVADFMAAGYHINQCTWLVASGPSQLELVVIDWFRRWIGYPEGAGGLFTSGGSAASVDAFVAAREAAGHPERATVYMSDQSHSALARAAMIVGVRRDRIRMIPSDPHFRMDMDALDRAVAEDRDAGLTPIAVAANAGTSGTGAIDRLEEMADFCAAEGLWLHVDAAYGGFAVVTEQGKRLLRGIERADFDRAGCAQVALPALRGGLPSGEGREHAQGRLRGPARYPSGHGLGGEPPQLLEPRPATEPLGAGAQGLDVNPGPSGWRRSGARSRRGWNWLARAEEYVRASPVLEAMNAVTLGIVCFRVNPVDDNLDEETLDKVNRTVLARMFWDDPAFISSTLLHGRFVLRMCIINYPTTWDDVRETLEAVERFGRDATSKAVHSST